VTKKPKRSAADEAAKAARLAAPGFSEFLERVERITAKHKAGTDVGSFTDMTSLSRPVQNTDYAKRKRGDALTRRLREIDRVWPEIDFNGLIARLRDEADESRGLIVKVDEIDELVTWKESPGEKQSKITKTPFSAIRYRLSRIKTKRRRESR